MPIYEYYCENCRETFSKLWKMSEADEAAPCPTCGASSRKQISACAIGGGGGGAFSGGPACAPGGG